MTSPETVRKLLLEALQGNDKSMIDYQRIILGRYWFKSEKKNEDIPFLEEQMANSNANAIYLLGFMYEIGAGYTQDPVKSLELYKLAANKNNAIAQYELSIKYQDTFQEEKQLDMLKKAAANKKPSAMYFLAYLYGNGYKLERYIEEAEQLLKSATFLGYDKLDYGHSTNWIL